MYDYDRLKNTLKNMSDKKHRDFHRSLVPNAKDTIAFLGIPIPKLRKLAKEILAECKNIDDYFTCVGNEFYEEIMLKGIVTGYLRCDYTNKCCYISAFVPYITDWAICDTFCSSIRIANADKERFLQFLEPYLNSEDEFFVRFGVVMLIRNYICDDFIAATLEKLKTLHHTQHYYIQMAVAWALCECYIKYPQLTLSLLKEKSFDAFIQNKAIQKCRESFRVSQSDKSMLLQYKIQ